jgi:hypothetical protein
MMTEIEKAEEALLSALRNAGIGKFGGTTVRDAIENLIDAKIAAALAVSRYRQMK